MKRHFRIASGGVLAAVAVMAMVGVVMAYDGPGSGGEKRDLPPGGAEQVADGVLPLAVQDMARRLGVDLAEISIAKIEDATWADTSLGLPVPGELYAQVVTPGFVVTLTAGNHTYVYHTDTTARVVLATIES